MCNGTLYSEKRRLYVAFPQFLPLYMLYIKTNFIDRIGKIGCTRNDKTWLDWLNLHEERQRAYSEVRWHFIWRKMWYKEYKDNVTDVKRGRKRTGASSGLESENLIFFSQRNHDWQLLIIPVTSSHRPKRVQACTTNEVDWCRLFRHSFLYIADVPAAVHSNLLRGRHLCHVNPDASTPPQCISTGNVADQSKARSVTVGEYAIGQYSIDTHESTTEK